MVASAQPNVCILINLIFNEKLAISKKHQLFIAVFTNVNWAKPAHPTEPIFSSSTLLMGGPAGNAAKSVVFL